MQESPPAGHARGVPTCSIVNQTLVMNGGYPWSCPGGIPSPVWGYPRPVWRYPSPVWDTLVLSGGTLVLSGGTLVLSGGTS